MSETSWKTTARVNMKATLDDQVLRKLLERSNLTRVQFETVLLDQIGSEMAEKRLTRQEMGVLRHERGSVSRGSFNRTLSQGRSNISEAVNTVLLLGYSGLLESPSLAPFVEASETLRGQLDELKKTAATDHKLYRKLVNMLLEELERANAALRGQEP